MELHVVFGTGPLGRAVAASLTLRGHRVRMVNRGGDATDVPLGAEVVAGNAYEVEEVCRVTDGAAVVYQCAQPPYTNWPRLFPPLQAAIIEGVARTKARLVIAENLYMYGDTQGGVITEDTPHRPHGPKGRTRALMTDQAMAAHKAGKVRVAIGRGSDFFGPRVSASVVGEGVFRRVLDGKPARAMGNPDLPHSYTYVGDFGEALAILGEREEAMGHVWHVPNAEPVTSRRFVEMVAEAAGRNPQMQVAGPILLGALGLVNREIRELWEMQYEFEKPFVVDSSRFERTFGVRATPLGDAIQQTVAWHAGMVAQAGTGHSRNDPLAPGRTAHRLSSMAVVDRPR
jgi:nucleoside-diphosphate-sugar epimerase